MLRRCMSLSRDTRFTVVSLVDLTHKDTDTQITKDYYAVPLMITNQMKAELICNLSWTTIDTIINIQTQMQDNVDTRKQKTTVTMMTSWLVSGQYEIRQAPTAFLKSLWAFSARHLKYTNILIL